MKLRDSYASINNKLIFVLYGPEWSLELDMKIPKEEEELIFGLTCTGVISPEDKDHAFVWIQSCSDVVSEKLGFEKPEEVHELFRDALQMGLDEQEK